VFVSPGQRDLVHRVMGSGPGHAAPLFEHHGRARLMMLGGARWADRDTSGGTSLPRPEGAL